MKYLILFTFFLSVLFSATISEAKIVKKGYNMGVVISEEAALLSQVDVVSLYLTTDSVVYAPRIIGDTINVEMTILDPMINANVASARDFAHRNVKTFIGLLTERLPEFAPALADSFDAKKDLRFKVNAGAARTYVGSWAGGSWDWARYSYAYGKADGGSAYVKKNKDKTKCDCPARR